MNINLKLVCSVCGDELEVLDSLGTEIAVKPCVTCEANREYRCSCGHPLEFLDYDDKKTWIQFDECEACKRGEIHTEGAYA